LVGIRNFKKKMLLTVMYSKCTNNTIKMVTKGRC